MSTGDGSPNGRQSVTTPTLTERVRSLAHGRRSSRFLRSSGGNQDGTATESESTVSSPYQTTEQRSAFVESCLLGMASTRPLAERMDAVKSAIKDIGFFSNSDLISTATAAEEVRNLSKTVETRRIILDVVDALVSHPTFEDAMRERLFTMMVSERTAMDARAQIDAIRRLTLNGSSIYPLEVDLCSFLARTVQALFEVTSKARSQLPKRAVRRSKGPIPEEEDLRAAFYLTRDVVNGNASTLPAPEFSVLLDKLFSVAFKTTSEYDLDGIIATMALITKMSRLPRHHLDLCVETLCGVAGMKSSADHSDLDASFQNLLESPDRGSVAGKILNILSSASLERHNTVTHGAALSFKKYIQDAKVTMSWQASLVFEALKRMSRMGARYRLLALEIFSSCTKHPELVHDIIGADWTPIYDLLDPYTMSEDAHSRWQSLGCTLSASSPLGRYMSRPVDPMVVGADEFRAPLLSVAHWLVATWGCLHQYQQGLALHFILVVGDFVDTSLYTQIVKLMLDNKSWLLADPDGFAHISILVASVLLEPSRPEGPRLAVLGLLEEILMTKSGTEEQRSRLVPSLSFILSSLQDDQNTDILARLAHLATIYVLDESTLASSAHAFLVHLTRRKVVTEQTKGTIDVSEMASRLLVKVFLSSLKMSNPRINLFLSTLVINASSAAVQVHARLSAMALLTRLRCNAEGAVKVDENADVLGLSPVLLRQETLNTQTSSLPITNSATPAPASPISRQARSSGINGAEKTRSRSTTRSGNDKHRVARSAQPRWKDPGYLELDNISEATSSHKVFIGLLDMPDGAITLDLSGWLDLILDIMRRADDWEIYSFVLVHLPSQLSNKAIFAEHKEFIYKLHDEIVSQLSSSQFMEPPTASGLKKGDVALCLYHALTVLLGYHQDLPRTKLEETVRLFQSGMARWDRVTRCCIHAITICFHELPECLERTLTGIVTKMSQIITQSHLAIDILEFLGGLARCPRAYENIIRNNQEFLRIIFGMCIRFIHYSREQGQICATGGVRQSFPSHRRSGFSSDQKTTSDQDSLADAQSELPEYVFTLAYHVITAWFLNIDIRQRPQHVGWIAKGLAWKDGHGNETLAEQSQVALDMMHRTTYLDLGETEANNLFREQHGRITKKSWLVGMSIITIETAADTGLTQVTKRQASGTTHSMYQPYIARLPAHHVPRHASQRGSGQDESPQMYPDHVLLQLLSTIAPMPIPLQPIVLPDDETVARALRTFDMNDTVDGYKAGVIYVGPKQTQEVEILANDAGSAAFDEFLRDLGTKVPLRDAPFKAQGLDQYSDQDGMHTYAWRDRVVEIVFHVSTMMPTNLVDDPQCIHKKKHIGNSFVNIIYNDSGRAYDFNTLSSQFNYVNIVITPNPSAPSSHLHPRVLGTAAETEEAGRCLPFFTVQTMCSPTFPQISPAATPKLVSCASLASFVRQLTLTASVFSQIWSTRDGGEHVSSWRNRLKEIIRLRERYSNTAISGNVSYPEMGTVHDRGGAKCYVEGDDWNGTLAMGGLAEHGQFLMSLDFTRWT